MSFGFTRSLFGKQAVATLFLASALSLVVSTITFNSNLVSSRQAIKQEFTALLALIEKPAIQAAFRIDALFAQQQMDGLMQNSHVLKAEMLDEAGQRFAFNEKPNNAERFYIEMADWLLPDIRYFSLDLYYQDQNVYLGKMIITAHRESLIKEVLSQNIRLLVSSLIKDLLLASLISLVFYWLVTRPLYGFTQVLKKQSLNINNPLPQLTPVGHENDELGELSLVFTRIWDQLTETHSALERNVAYTQAIIAHAGDAIFLVSEDGKIKLVNKASENLIGRDHSGLIGSYLGEFHTNEDWESFSELLITLPLNKPLTIETFYLADNGIKTPVEIRLIKYHLQKNTEVLLLVRDISARKEAESRINRLAFYDPLTHLPNRRYLMDQLDIAMKDSIKNKTTGCLFFLDLDRFKNINDSLGHNVGDSLLRLVAADLESVQFDGAMTARLGGDEFVMLLPRLEGNEEHITEKIATTAQNIIDVCAMPKKVGFHELHITVSIGIATFNGDEMDVTSLLKQADTALYKAKDVGKNTYRFYRPEMQAMSDERLAMDKALHQALEKNEFQLYYQPQNNEKGDCIGAEVLIRWPREDSTFTSPAVFIPIAEEIGLINEIGDWVIEESFKQLATWLRDNMWSNDWKLSINVSPIQFQHPAFVVSLEMLLVKYSIPAHYIDLEITENMLLNDLALSREKMDKIRTLGISLSIDDFGTGYSSLKYLKTLPITRLKIDQTFVRDLLEDSSDEAIVGAIIAMANALGIEVLAEGVETQAHYERLLDMGCILYQGYHFGYPVPASQFMKT